MQNKTPVLLLLILLGCFPSLRLAQAEDLDVSIQIDASRDLGTLKPIWRFFGYDEPNYTYMQDGKKLLANMGKLGTPQAYVRTHHLLTSGDGSPALKWGSTGVYREDPAGRPIYDFTILDRIFSTYLERGLKPFVQLGFMPEALSSHPQDYPQNPPPDRMVDPGQGFSYPPKDYARWGELCYNIARHNVEKLGADEVNHWYWEVWNEPNIRYWRGTREEYFRLYDHAIAGVRKALPTARVGGPHTAGGPGGTFLQAFLEHCLRGTNAATGKTGSPLDFVAFHAKGSPVFTNGHVRMGISSQLRNIDSAFAVIASFPEVRRKPIIIGESDPEGCAACKGPHLNYRNGTMYSSYTAASFPRKLDLATKHGVTLEGALTWALEFEDQPWFAGFRALASNGIELPVFNVFRMFSQMRGQRLPVQSSGDAGLETILREGIRKTADISALAARDGNTVHVLAWHYHDDDLPGPAATVTIQVNGLAGRTRINTVRHYRIDADHSNAYETWKRMGEPAEPSPDQYAKLERASQLAQTESPTTELADDKLKTTFSLPRQAVTLLTFDLK